MNLENLEVEIVMEEESNQARIKYLREHPEEAAKEKEEEELFRAESKKQIADYIKTFKQLPNKDLWFANDWFDSYHITEITINPLKNFIHCYIQFQ